MVYSSLPTLFTRAKYFKVLKYAHPYARTTSTRTRDHQRFARDHWLVKHIDRNVAFARLARRVTWFAQLVALREPFFISTKIVISCYQGAFVCVLSSRLQRSQSVTAKWQSARYLAYTSRKESFVHQVFRQSFYDETREVLSGRTRKALREFARPMFCLNPNAREVERRRKTSAAQQNNIHLLKSLDFYILWFVLFNNLLCADFA